ncbi:N-acetylmuramoyl-L-alanine amidase, partial [Muriicola sp.]
MKLWSSYKKWTGILIFLLWTSCATTRIVDRPIIFDAEREQLTRAYMAERYGLQDSLTITPRMIVLHWTAIPTLEGSFDAFNDPLIPQWRTLVGNAGKLNVSSHFLVGRDGTIYR